MKTLITVLCIVLAGIVACESPEPTTTNSGDTTMNGNRPIDTTMQQDTAMHHDTIPQP